MATYREIASGETDTDSPIVQPLMDALRLNPIAIAEGAADAPHIEAQWYPFDSAAIGDGNEGVIYDHATDGDVASVESPDFVDGFEYEFTFENLSGGSLALNMQLFRATSGSYSTAFNLHDGGLGGIYGRVWIPTPRIASKIFSVNYTTPPSTAPSGNSTAAIGDPGFRVTLGTVQKIGKVQFSGTSDFTGGRILMRQRRVHV